MKKFLLISVISLFALVNINAMTKDQKSIPQRSVTEKQNNIPVVTDLKIGKKTTGNKSLRRATKEGITTRAKLTLPTSEKQSYKNSNLISRASDFPPIYGYLEYDLDLETASLYKIEKNNLEYLWYDPLIEDYNSLAKEGWYEDGKINGVVIDLNGNIIQSYYKYSLDFQTGEILSYEDYGMDIKVMFINARYNTEDGNIYGFAYDFNNEGKICWAMANPYDLYTTKILNDNTTYCYSLCYNETDGKFYGVNTQQEFVSIENNGQQTVMMTVPEAENFATYFAGLVWAPSANAFYWNAQYADDASALYKVTLEGDFYLEEYYPTGTEFTYMFTTESVVNPELPARPSISAVEFENGDLSGKVTFNLPSTMSDGVLIPEGTSLSYTILLDDEVYETGEGITGDQIVSDFKIKTDGYHKFGIFVSLDGHKSGVTSRTVWIGYDTPLAPSKVEISLTEVTWNAVGNQGAHGGYVNVDEVEYEVYINDIFKGSTTSTSLPISFSDDETIAKYMAMVYAVFDDKKSKGGSSNEILAGRPYQVPMYIEPTYEEFELMVIEDKNHDGITWSYWKDHNALGTLYTNNYDDFFDDYIFLPPVEITNTDKFYIFSLEAAIRASNYPDEYLEVVYASAPSSDAIMGVLVPEFAPKAHQYEEPWTRKEGLWIVPSAGTYYIGIHATSPGDQLGLLAKSFRLTESDIDENSPSAPHIEEIIAGSQGALRATVNFTYPTTLLNGDIIDENSNLDLGVIVNGEKAEISMSGKPGEISSCEVETLQGRNEISIYVTLNGLDSPSDITSVFTGQTVPATPKNLKGEVSEDMMSLSLSWDAVTTPDNRNGYVNPEDIRYAVYVQVRNVVSYKWELLMDEITDTHCTIKLTQGAPQDEYVFGVGSYNPAGDNDEVMSITAFMGTPYPLPMIDNFEDPEGIFEISPWFLYPEFDNQNYTAVWYTYNLEGVDESFVGDNRAVLYCLPETIGDKGLMGIPRFETLNCENAEISVRVVIAPYTPDFKILGQIYGSNDIIEVGSYIQESTGEAKIGTIDFALPQELLHQHWVQLYIETSFKSLNEMFVLWGLEVTSTSSVQNIFADGSITSGKNTISIIGFNGKDIIIASLDGKTIVNEKCKSDKEDYILEKGIYIVRAGSHTAKLIVK